MYIACTKNHGVEYLQVHESYNVIENGKNKRKGRVVRNIGPLSRYDDGKPDYVKRLRKSFKEGCPIIIELTELAKINNERKGDESVTITFNKINEDECICEPKNIGYFLLDGLYDSLGIYDVLKLEKSRSKIEYDVNGLCKLLLFGRVLEAESKFATWSSNERYLFNVVWSKNPIEIYRTLDVLCEKAETIQGRMNLKITDGVGRDKDICFYDVTNYWFEIDDKDEDLIDKNGDIIKEGMRKSGPSKSLFGIHLKFCLKPAYRLNLSVFLFNALSKPVFMLFVDTILNRL